MVSVIDNDEINVFAPRLAKLRDTAQFAIHFSSDNNSFSLSQKADG